MKKLLTLSLVTYSLPALSLGYQCLTVPTAKPSIQLDMIFDSSGGGLTVAWISEDFRSCSLQDQKFIDPKTKEEIYDYGGERIAIGLFCDKEEKNPHAQFIKPFQLLVSKPTHEHKVLEGAVYRDDQKLSVICKEVPATSDEI